MKFLLAAVNAKFIHSNPAVYSLRACAGPGSRPHIDLAEYTINQRMQDILADLYARKPDAIGFSCYIWNWELIRGLLGELPKLLPATDLWLGGPEVSYDAPGILRQFPQLAGIMVGEGEETFRELLAWYVDRGEGGAGTQAPALEEIAGLCLPARCGGDGSPFYTPVRELADINALVFPYGEPGGSGAPSRAGLADLADRILYYESSRGCPYRCSYCLSSIDKKLRLRDIDVVKRELQFFLDNGVKQVKFVDRTFNCDHEHAMAVWEYIHKNDNGVTNFHFEISADLLREDEIALLNRLRPGLVQLEIGVQSVNPDTLKAVRRAADTEKLLRNAAAIRRGNNIHLHLDLIAGLPYEDYGSFGRSFNRVYALGPEQLQLGFLKVLKGSAMQEEADQYGICYLSEPPYEVLYTKWLSYGDLLRLKRIEEMVELYYNSSQFRHTIAFLERAFASPFEMYEALADFYGGEGHFARSPARAARYEILLRFAALHDGENTDRYRELLTYDMYLRENLKSRPAFAPEWSREVKEAVKDFYRREERERVYLAAYAAYDGKQMSRMTHLEPFRFPVWDDEAMRDEDTEQGLRYVLFDYNGAARDPLTFDAAVCVTGALLEQGDRRDTGKRGNTP